MTEMLLISLFAAAALQSAQPAPPQTQKTVSIRSTECQCPETHVGPELVVEGLVVDAEVTLASDGLSVADRRATVFMISASNADIKGRTKIWHDISKRACGVNFDYGKKYKIALRKTDAGLETNACLMKQIKSDAEKSGD